MHWVILRPVVASHVLLQRFLTPYISQTDAMKKMERKFQEQNQQRETLTRLLNIIKDRDPGLLKTLHKSLNTR